MEKEVKIKTDSVEWDYKPVNVDSLDDVLNIVEEIAYGCEDLADCSLEQALENCIQKTKEYADGTTVLNDYESDLLWADRADKLRKAYTWLNAHRPHKIVTGDVWTVLIENGNQYYSNTFVFNTLEAADKFVDELRKRAGPYGQGWEIYEPCHRPISNNWEDLNLDGSNLEQLFEDDD